MNKSLAKILASQKSIKSYWDKYYVMNIAPNSASSFSKFVTSYFEKIKFKLLVEIGCGNGRDVQELSKISTKYLGIDISSSAIKFCNKVHFAHNKYFECMGLDKSESYFTNNSVGAFYLRFSLHAMNNEDQSKIINLCYRKLIPGGIAMIEVRSIRDTMMTLGTKISDFENFTDHYRCYVKFESLIDLLNLEGFSIDYSIESQGLARHKDEDPWIIRVIARKA